MAGYRHHILPRFLLKGFASQVVGKDVFTWVYWRQGKIREINTLNVNVEKYFYGKEGEISADAEITDVEGGFAKFLDELRDKDDQVEVSNLNVAEFIAHLCVRTKHLRESYRESSEFLIERVSEYLLDIGILKAFILNHPELMKQQLEKVIEDYPFLELYKDMLLQLGPTMAIAFFDENNSEIQKWVQPLISNFKSILPKALKEGHIKALAKAPIPEPRAENYRVLRWFVCKSESPLILGDVGCLFEIFGAKKYKSLNEKDDEIRNIYLPISSNRMLIGTSLSSVPKVEFRLIEEAIAKYSREFFVCSESSLDKASLLSLIGKESEIVTKEELDKLMNEISKEITG